MDSSKKYDNPNPRITTNPLSKLVFWWLIPLFRYGKTHDLETKDLQNVLPPDLSGPLGDVLERNWKKEVESARDQQRNPKLRKAIQATFMLSYIIYGLWIFLTVILRIVQPYVFGLLMWHFDPRADSTTSEAYIYASCIILISITISLLEQHTNMGQLELGMRTRIACSSLVYRKILRLSRFSANKTAGGQVINLLSNDVARFDQLFMHLHYIWIMPIQTAVIAYLIWRNVGMATLAGIFLITIQTIPLQGYLGTWISKFRERIATRTDERVRLMSEIINGIQVIKMYTWEKPFQELVSLARKYEIDILTIMSYLRGINCATFVYTDRTTLFFTIMAFVLGGNNISADIVFSMAQYFNGLQCLMAIYYPMAVSAFAEALVSVRRLENFLLMEENTPLPIAPSHMDSNAAIKMKEAAASWIENSIANTLHNINVTINSGELYALIGPVGSGKSSLLQLILSELRANHGHVSVNGKISYASQEPWLFAGSVRNNILFGQPYDEKRYREVTRVCALYKDFIQLPQGDKTLVGERGASLSGGQRARINLARAIYRNVDIYLLDDPLSAVDTQVGKSLFNDCIKEYLSNKTRILVTHQVQYLKHVDMIIMLNNGVIEKQGKLNDFNEEHLKLLASNATEEKNDNNQLTDSELNPMSEVILAAYHINEDNADEPQETDELIAKGGVSKSLYWRYFRAGGSIAVLLIFLLFAVIAQLGSSGSDWWVARWTMQEEVRLKNVLADGNPSSDESPIDNSSFPNDNETLPFNKTTTTTSDIFYYDTDTALWIYGIFIIASVVMTTARNIMFYKICMSASKNLHNTMFGSLLRAPMRFFNTHPSGQILNRFSKDTGCVDELLPMAMIDSMQIFLVMIGILGQVIIIYWWTIFPILIMGILYWCIRNLYLATAQDLKRLEGITKSPVFSHVNSSLAGLATIRSSGSQEMVQNEFDSHQDVNTGAYSLFITTSTAFGLWLDAVTIVFVAFITYSFIFLHNDNTFAGSVGLAISQILILCGMMQYGMRQTAEMVAQMTSVERILQFTELDKEGPFDSEPIQKPPLTWPAKGHITFDHVYLKYSDTDEPVLKDLNVTIQQGMKVGIVGRTGAGKSSLISALFNLAKLDGDIFIDDINTKKIGLHNLRSKISIIPQEPMLFSATLRDNLDPFHQYEDNVLWSALEEVELKVAVPSLDHQVTQGGSNFSAGQRQLLCLARAIVRNNKILVLDEATANVDPATDGLIQKTIREKFKDCTVLTIAHRLNTVMDSDRALVMDQGQIVEFDYPHVLLQNPNGYLMNMVNQTGKSMTEKLKKISEDAYNSVLHDVDLKEHNLINDIPKSRIHG